ncbi:TetR/AcrR family transcriptional regulator [Kineococcus rhizosphaerae]|uniref:TetR family transcriptional regulator n=1 Tax=Kineococcus rhizosphaerae TaxID=559628 RepID=A0A2T0QUS7_9ACTN|nr:TetR/AcrR family transcriptional regulator [Kineococcus rhizosphaerae]PRY08929.1 TetR family transcriptional regulator [Kineococcus rhizosphaerae]
MAITSEYETFRSSVPNGIDDPDLANLVHVLAAASAGTGEVRGDTRERLLVAAIEAFAREGFGGTSMRTLASAVGIKAAAIYAHFPSKESILSAALARAYCSFLVDVVVPQDGDEPWRRLDGLCRRHMTFQLNRSGLAAASDSLLNNQSVLTIADPTVQRVLREARSSYFGWLYREVVHLRRSVRSPDARVQTRCILTLCDSLTQSSSDVLSVNHEAVIDRYMAVVWNILGIHDPTERSE